MTDVRSTGLFARFPDLPIAAASIGGFWLFYFATALVRAVMIEGDFSTIGQRAVACLVGILLTFLVWIVLRRAAAESLTIKAIAAAIACIPAAAIFATFNLAFFLYLPLATETLREQGAHGELVVRSPAGELRIERKGATPVVVQMPGTSEILRKEAPRMIGEAFVTWYFFFAAWASFYIALSSVAQLRAAERRASRAEREAQSAQIRALRYQVNPHFLFNTLNSLSSLVMSRRPEEAERMIVNLSTFFRSTLTIDPTGDVTLAEEIGSQRLYLDIEKVRFPHRLHVDAQIPNGLGKARVPPLILQPIVENAIKHGVARTGEAVNLSIRAHEEGGQLVVVVENDRGPEFDEERSRRGTGVGLANVCERLAARFGDAAECEAGPLPDGGYRVTLTMPLEEDA
ncbi:MAG: sensor histidine kinase [Alphaproteobacteria bacterium]|nr:sensor histidine kinase [Alphaproteobacteria bacterium]MDB5723015.1 sensor histidine kinase [Alphaproteobacteria bacterium]